MTANTIRQTTSGFIDSMHVEAYRVTAAETGFALETRNFPNAPNEPRFPSSVLRPGETYDHRMEITFSTIDL